MVARKGVHLAGYVYSRLGNRVRQDAKESGRGITGQLNVILSVYYNLLDKVEIKAPRDIDRDSFIELKEEVRDA